MKDLKSTLKLNFLLSVGTLTVVVTFLALPALAEVRSHIAASAGFSINFLLIPPLALLLGLDWFLFQRSVKIAAEPMQRLAQEAETGEQGFAFKTKSKSTEEDALKHSIESKNLRIKECKLNIEDLENELDRANGKLEELRAKTAKQEARLQESDQTVRELRISNDTLKASKLALELTLENERKSKVGIEVQKRTDEIYEQMERAVSAAAFKAVWIPSLVHELKTPISAINELAQRLNESWDTCSIAKAKDEVAAIYRHSEAQLVLLEGILARQPQDFEIKPSAPAAEEEIQPCELDAVAPEPTMPDADPQFLEAPEPETALESTPIEAEAEADTTPEAESAEPLPFLFDSAQPAPRPATDKRSDYDLQKILSALVEEFSLVAPDANITFSVDEELEIEITDETLLSLLHCLVEVAVSRVEEGDITIGVDLHPDSIEFDVACDGKLRHGDDIDLSRAKGFASELNGEIEIDAASPSELHLSYQYRFESVGDDSVIEV